MISVGALVRFKWWSEYRAPSATVGADGHTTWHEIRPGDTGVVLCVFEETFVVLFSSVDTLLKVHRSMLEQV